MGLFSMRRIVVLLASCLSICLCICLCICICICLCMGSCVNGNTEIEYECVTADRTGHSIRNITADEFYNSLENPRIYEIDGVIRAGVVPHHLTASPLISGFFSLVSAERSEYGTVVIVAPDHLGDRGDIIVSDLDWGFNGGVICDTETVNKLLDDGNLGVVVDNDRIEQEHSASVLIPYINHFLPTSKVVTVLVSRTISFDKTLALATKLNELIIGVEKGALLVCSIDFSHYLEPSKAIQNNDVVIEAIHLGDYFKIYGLSNDYVDSPAALIIFLRYLSKIEAVAVVLDNTEASEFAPLEVFSSGETTSYLVLAGLRN